MSIQKKVCCLFLIIILIVVFFSPNNPNETNTLNILAKPSKEYLLGCDHLGRDLYSRIITGSKASIQMAVVGVFFISSIGTLAGILAGFFKGNIEIFIMRVTDIMLAFPGMVLSIGILGILGPGAKNALLALIIPGWAEYARMARAFTLRERENDYVKTATLNGNSNIKIMLKHILPNILRPLVALIFISLSNFILRFSGLAFLGLGFKPPQAELGLILSEAKDYMLVAPHYMIYPGLALFFIVLSFNVISNIIKKIL